VKKYLLFVGLLLVSHQGKTQVLISLLFGDKLNSDKLEFGLEGGVNWYSMRGLEGAENAHAFNLGFYFDMKMKNPALMFNAGLMLKSGMGAGDLPIYSLNDQTLDNAFDGGYIDRKISYLSLPAMMKYHINRSIYVKSGIQLGLRTKAKDEFYNEVSEQDDLTYVLDVQEKYRRLDAGLALGLGYRLMKGKGMHIGIQYYYGLINVSKDDAIPGQYNRSFYLTAGLPIGKGKTKDHSTDK
jgi:hypothetical protein